MTVLTPEDYNIINQFCSLHKQFTRLSHPRQTQFIRLAVETGNQVARNIKQDYNEVPLSRLLDRLGIKIEYDYLNQQIGNMVVRAKYTGNPPTITIYRKVMQLLAQSNKLSFSIERLEEIALVHELYHHLALSEIPNSKFQIPNQKIRRKIPRLFDELAAQSFVYHFLSIASFQILLGELSGIA